MAGAGSSAGTRALQRLAAANVDRVRCDVFQGAFGFAGGERYGSKDRLQVKEQADYNLKYLVAVALLDDQVGPAQLQPARMSWDRTVEKQLDLRPLSGVVDLLAKVRPTAVFAATHPGIPGA